MREPAALVGGQIEIGPGADAGTRVRLLLPAEAS
jgi:signal transduction histidine kinase